MLHEGLTITPQAASDQFRVFHPENQRFQALDVMKDFDTWKYTRWSSREIGRCKWWFWDANPELAMFMRNGMEEITVGEAAQRFKQKTEELLTIDPGFVRKINSIQQAIAAGVKLPPIIAVKGRNPISVPSIVEGNHRSLAILLASMESSNKIDNLVLLGTKKLI